MAKVSKNVPEYKRKVHVKHRGVHSKKRHSNSKRSKYYSKAYNGQGR